MTKILMICHGNICRSTMAEFVMKEMVRAAGRSADFEIASAGTSREEIGNDTHYGTKAKLREQGVPFTPRRAKAGNQSGLCVLRLSDLHGQRQSAQFGADCWGGRTGEDSSAA